MSDKFLKTKDYCDAAKDLRCEVAALMAVAEVESSGDGYDESGRIKIRFEGHKFREYTFGKYDKSHPHLSYPYKVQEFKKHGYNEFNQAFALDEEAALKASSPGKFQPLGANYREAGFKSVRDFWDFLRASERNQLLVFCKMVKFRQIDDELRHLDWAGFAKNYNGSAYRDNDYDGKMKRAYDRHKKRNINCNEFADLRDEEIKIVVPTVKVNPSPDVNNETDNVSAPTQIGENITNVDNSTKNVPDNFKPEDKTVIAPPPSGMLKKAWIWVLSLGIVPPSAGAAIETVRNLAADGSLNLKDSLLIAGQIGKFVFPYVVYLAIAFVVFWGLKELFKQLSLMLTIYVNGRGDMNNVAIKPMSKTPVEIAPELLSASRDKDSMNDKA